MFLVLKRTVSIIFLLRTLFEKSLLVFCTGRHGETIRQMSRASKCKIYIDRTQDDYRDRPRVVSISGPKEQIEVAKVGLTLKAPPIICSRLQLEFCSFFKNNK